MLCTAVATPESNHHNVVMVTAQPPQAPEAVTPPHADRLKRLIAALHSHEVGVMFLPPSADLEYLTGVPRLKHESDPSWDRSVLAQGCLIGQVSDPIFLLGHGEWALEVRSLLAAHDVRLVSAGSDPIQELRKAGKDAGLTTRLAIGDWTSFRQVEALREAFPDSEFVPASPLTLPLRLQKDEVEIARIREAGELAVGALEATLPHFGTSFSRHDFIEELAHRLLQGGSDGLAYRPDIYVAGPTTGIEWAADCRGEAAAEVHAPASMTVDLGAIIGGYRSDIGRTVFVGDPPTGAEAALLTVKRAQQAAVTALSPGARPEAIDQIAHEVVDADGLGDAFTIPCGHGIGLEIHEPPRLVSGVTEPLPSGAVVTVEVGAWRPGSLAVFCEDEVVVRPGAAERLTNAAATTYVI
jgi:Xaa-Pro aminopeptidase